jgi:hypothetical protein
MKMGLRNWLGISISLLVGTLGCANPYVGSNTVKFDPQELDGNLTEECIRELGEDYTSGETIEEVTPCMEDLLGEVAWDLIPHDKPYYITVALEEDTMAVLEEGKEHGTSGGVFSDAYLEGYFIVLLPTTNKLIIRNAAHELGHSIHPPVDSEYGNHLWAEYLGRFALGWEMHKLLGKYDDLEDTTKALSLANWEFMNYSTSVISGEGSFLSAENVCNPDSWSWGDDYALANYALADRVLVSGADMERVEADISDMDYEEVYSSLYDTYRCDENPSAEDLAAKLEEDKWLGRYCYVRRYMDSNPAIEIYADSVLEIGELEYQFTGDMCK